MPSARDNIAEDEEPRRIADARRRAHRIIRVVAEVAAICMAVLSIQLLLWAVRGQYNESRQERLDWEFIAPYGSRNLVFGNTSLQWGHLDAPVPVTEARSHDGGVQVDSYEYIRGPSEVLLLERKPVWHTAGFSTEEGWLIPPGAWRERQIVDLGEIRVTQPTAKVRFRVNRLEYWCVALIIGLAPAIRGVVLLFRWREYARRKARARRGLCAGCGYDLRKTPSRCPECGLVPAPRSPFF